MGALKLPDFVRAFLEEATEGIRDPKSRSEAQDELHSHLEDAAERDFENGIARDESYKRTIEAFGDPKKLARGFKRAHKPWFLRWTVMVPSLILSGFVIAAAGGTVYASIQFARKSQDWRERQDLRNEILQYHRDLKAAEPFFSKTFIGGRNAAAYLNPRVPWIGGPAAQAEAAELRLPVGIVRDMIPTGPLDVRSLPAKTPDFSWMKKLHAFDYWELVSEDSPSVAFLATGNNFSALPVPDVITLGDWARLRLGFAYRQGGLAAALRDVHRLAQLEYSTEILIGTQSAISLFALCNRYYEAGVRAGKIAARDWTPMHLPEPDRLRLIGWSAIHWTDFFAPNDFKNELFAMQPVIGGCAALSELGMIASNLRSFDYVNSPLPFEVNFTSHIEDLNKFASSQAPYCRMTILKLALNNKFRQPTGTYGWQNMLMVTPYLRQFLFAYWFGSFRVDWLGGYENRFKRSGA